MRLHRCLGPYWRLSFFVILLVTWRPSNKSVPSRVSVSALLPIGALPATRRFPCCSVSSCPAGGARLTDQPPSVTWGPPGHLAPSRLSAFLVARHLRCHSNYSGVLIPFWRLDAFLIDPCPPNSSMPSWSLITLLVLTACRLESLTHASLA